MTDLAPTSATIPTRILRYQHPTPLADAARAHTRQLMARHLRSGAVEIWAAISIFASLGFAVACQL